jgi:hypothetical protein
MVLTDKQLVSARLSNLSYIWRIELRNGKEIYQFDPQGVECSLEAKLLEKTEDDPYFGNMVWTGVKNASFIPVSSHMDEVYVDLAEGQDLVLFRRNYKSLSTGSIEGKYTIYCIGTRYYVPPKYEPVEQITYICPPADFPIANSKGESRMFTGFIETGKAPNHVNPYERFLNSLDLGVKNIV